MSGNDISLGAEIKAKRQREHLSLRQAAEVSGVAFSTLGRIENGAEPSLKVDRLIRAWLSGATPILPPPAMELRDWFAGQSINSLLVTATGTKIDARIIAEGAYGIADAMLAERAKEQP